MHRKIWDDTFMGYEELFISQSNVFSGLCRPFNEAEYVIIGVPFDATSTYRTGARFGPNAIRAASLNIETYSFRTGLDVEDIPLNDMGDLHVSTDALQTLEKLELVVKDVAEKGKKPVIIGGEHTITLGVLRGFGAKASKTAIISFDAHLDLRDEFMGLRLSHTTFMRRINEDVKPTKIVEVDTRAVCKEEINYAQKNKIMCLTAHQIRKAGIERTITLLKKKLEDAENIYISVDMDVLDPAYAPAVQNPEPEGLEPSTLLDILYGICDKRLLGFDVVEVAPNYDMGVTAIQAAKIIFEMLCIIERQRTE